MRKSRAVRHGAAVAAPDTPFRKAEENGRMTGAGGAQPAEPQEWFAGSYHMTPDDFRRWGNEAVDWIATYMDRPNSSGDLFLTHTRLDGRLILRMSIGPAGTEHRHVTDAWEAISRVAAECLES
jgi:hypothetical protein